VGKLFTTLALVIGLSAGTAAIAGADDWAVNADFTDACSCNASCPCIYGSPPTQGFCEGNALIEVKKGHYGDVNLDGVSAVVTYHMGADGAWSKYYVSDKASDSQAKALSKLVPPALGFLSGAKVLSVEKAPIDVERTASMVKYSGPVSSVELQLMTNADGKPIRVDNLPAKGFPGPKYIDFTQYRTVELVHKDGEGAFSHARTSGFTTKISASSKN